MKDPKKETIIEFKPFDWKKKPEKIVSSINEEYILYETLYNEMFLRM